MMNIIFFGDSICTGQYISLHSNWISRISSRLYKNVGDNIVVTNASANGRTTRQALEVLHYEVLSKSPDILVIQFGLNDANIWEDSKGMCRVSVEAFAANLVEIIRKAANFGIRKIFLLTNHPIEKESEHTIPADLYMKLVSSYNEAIRSVSDLTFSLESTFSNLTVSLIDIERAMLQTNIPYCLLNDGIHLNAEGHSFYFDLIYPEIESAVVNLLYGKST